MNGYLNNSDRLVNRCSSHHLCNFHGIDVGSVKHGAEIGVNLILNKTRQSRQKANIKTEGITTQWLKHKIKGRFLQEADVNFLNLLSCQLLNTLKTTKWVTDVREWNLKLDLEFHESRKLHILNDDRNALTDNTLSNAGFKNNFPEPLSVFQYFAECNLSLLELTDSLCP